MWLCWSPSVPEWDSSGPAPRCWIPVLPSWQCTGAHTVIHVHITFSLQTRTAVVKILNKPRRLGFQLCLAWVGMLPCKLSCLQHPPLMKWTLLLLKQRHFFHWCVFSSLRYECFLLCSFCFFFFSVYILPEVPKQWPFGHSGGKIHLTNALLTHILLWDVQEMDGLGTFCSVPQTKQPWFHGQNVLSPWCKVADCIGIQIIGVICEVL